MASRITALMLIPEPLPRSEVYAAPATLPVTVTGGLGPGRSTGFMRPEDIRVRGFRQRHRNIRPASNICLG